MIFIAVYFCYAVSILFIMGCATRRLLEKISSPQSFAFPPNLVNILILGMISLTIFISFVSIVSPITLYVHILVIISLSVYIYFDKKYFSKTVKFFLSEIRMHLHISSNHYGLCTCWLFRHRLVSCPSSEMDQ
jgi:hypothetical protein